MAKIGLKNILENKAQINEELYEPSDQILKSLTAYFKQETGVNIKSYGASRRNATGDIIYWIPMMDELKTPLLKAIFKSLGLKLLITELKGAIGGYDFKFVGSYATSKGAEPDVLISHIIFKNNQFQTIKGK